MEDIGDGKDARFCLYTVLYKVMFNAHLIVHCKRFVVEVKNVERFCESN